MIAIIIISTQCYAQQNSQIETDVYMRVKKGTVYLALLSEKVLMNKINPDSLTTKDYLSYHIPFEKGIENCIIIKNVVNERTQVFFCPRGTAGVVLTISKIEENQYEFNVVSSTENKTQN